MVVASYLLTYLFFNFRNFTQEYVTSLGITAMNDFKDPYLERYLKIVFC